jgi:hypothetical protein
MTPPNSALQPGQQVEDLGLDGSVQCGGRLVRDDQLRAQRERHRDHRALPHAAGELVRVPAGYAPIRALPAGHFG